MRIYFPVQVDIQNKLGTDLGGGLSPPLGPIIYLYIYSYYIFYFCSWAPFQNFRPLFSPINLLSLTQIATIQPKKLTKTIKNIHNGDCILAPQKKKKLFYHQRTNKKCVIGEVKAKTKFFTTIVNWYKYHLTVANC